MITEDLYSFSCKHLWKQVLAQANSLVAHRGSPHRNTDQTSEIVSV